MLLGPARSGRQHLQAEQFAGHLVVQGQATSVPVRGATVVRRVDSQRNSAEHTGAKSDRAISSSSDHTRGTLSIAQEWVIMHRERCQGGI